MSKADYTFTQMDDDPSKPYDFRAQKEARLEVKAEDANGEALADVFVTVSSGKTILKG